MTNTQFQWVIGGEAGFGIMITGLTLSKVASRSGYHLLDYVEYPSLIRGGHNAYMVTFSDIPVHALKETIDLLVCLNPGTFDLHKHRLTEHSVVIHDKDEFEIEGTYNTVHVPFRKILREEQGQSIMKNTIALGASVAAMGGDLTILNDLIAQQFEKKGEKVIAFNKLFIQKGYDSVVQGAAAMRRKVMAKKDNIKEQLVLTGNDAFALGAVMADCKLYSAYPMTPSSSVLTTLASWQEKASITVRHAEDEIAVISTAVGGSHAGARTAVGTSGGGFALMVESISLAGIAEVPIVIFLSQRPGPATGMPTWTEQGDLLFAVHAGHGEFPKIVITPGDIEEMIRMTTEAFDLADLYQTPVIVMSDMYLSDSHKSMFSEVAQKHFGTLQLHRGKTVSTPTDRPYLRYKVQSDGISERLVPGAQGFFYQANSYEHMEDGHTSETAEDRVAQVNKRNAKEMTYLKQHFKLPVIYGDLLSAKHILVTWGSGKGVCLEVKDQRADVAVIHFTHVHPMDEAKVKPLFERLDRCVLVEQNSTGQFGKLLRQSTGVTISKKILRYDGRPLTASEVMKKLI